MLTEIADEVINEATKLGVPLPPDAADHHWSEWSSLGRTPLYEWPTRSHDEYWLIFYRSFYRVSMVEPRTRTVMKGYVAKKGNRWYAVIYDELDPVTGRERRIWHPAGTDRNDAEQLATRLAADVNGRNDDARALSFGQLTIERLRRHDLLGALIHKCDLVAA
jgi:hypothetical protein